MKNPEPNMNSQFSFWNESKLQNITSLFKYITFLIYSEYSPFFLLHMTLNYYKLNRRKEEFKIKCYPKELFFRLLQNHSSLFDINDTVIVSKSLLYDNNERFIKLRYSPITDAEEQTRVLLVAALDVKNTDTIIVSDVLAHTLKISLAAATATIEKLTHEVEFAEELELSMIKSPTVDLSYVYIDTILENFFTFPKVLSQGDIIEVCLKTYGKHIYYSSPSKIPNSNCSIYFKCKKLVAGRSEQASGSFLCSTKQTTVKQVANSQSYLPARLLKCCSYATCNQEICSVPYGLKSIFNKLKSSVNPFIINKNLNLFPTFLLQGRRGSGKDLLLSSLADHLGMHYYAIKSIDLTANIYAQNETKLTNVLFNAKISSPCLLVIQQFENFGINNEGEYDERIMGHFLHELPALFKNNNFPVILFCSCDSNEVPVQLRRVFLEIFDINAPTLNEREEILQWLLQFYHFHSDNINLKYIASQTNGFFYGDLNALVNRAYLNLQNDNTTKASEQLLENCFIKALDWMQENYNENLGAPKVPKVQWSDIGGLNDVKQEIIKTLNLPLKYPELIPDGLKRSGILLFGPPGTGKTLLAKAVATECGLCFLSVKGPELLNMYVGQSEQNIRHVFEKARQASPCIIFFDELDSLAPNRGKSGDSGGVMDRVVSQLLAEMDGLNETAVVFIIGATNRPDLIDPGLLRPGRFDKLLYVGPCTDKTSKLSVLKALTRKFKLHDEVDLEQIVDLCPDNITGADFYGICSNSWTSAVRRVIKNIEKGQTKNHEDLKSESVMVKLEDFKNAIKNVKLSVSQKDLLYFEKLKRELGS